MAQVLREVRIELNWQTADVYRQKVPCRSQRARVETAHMRVRPGFEHETVQRYPVLIVRDSGEPEVRYEAAGMSWPGAHWMAIICVRVRGERAAHLPDDAGAYVSTVHDGYNAWHVFRERVQRDAPHRAAEVGPA